MSKKYWDQILTSTGVSNKVFSSSLAEKILAKQGWTKGSGLGKKEDGKKEPVQVRRRAENAGLGSSTKRAPQKMWWEDLYNETAKRIAGPERIAEPELKKKRKVKANS